MKRFLLDTNQFVFALQSPAQLSAGVNKILETQADHVSLSVVSLWEVMLKHQSRHPSGESKLPLFKPLPAMLDAMLDMGVALLGLESEHIFANLTTPLQHSDPFDHLLLKQCQVEHMQLLTSDQRLLSHPLVAQGI